MPNMADGVEIGLFTYVTSDYGFQNVLSLSYPQLNIQ